MSADNTERNLGKILQSIEGLNGQVDRLRTKVALLNNEIDECATGVQEVKDKIPNLDEDEFEEVKERVEKHRTYWQIFTWVSGTAVGAVVIAWGQKIAKGFSKLF